MNRKEFFMSLGFTKYEALALIALVQLKAATPKEIHAQSGVPQNKLYRILSKFEGQGILAQTPADVKRYKLINLATFIDGRIREQEQAAKALREHAANFEHDDRAEQFLLIRGQRAIMDRLAEQNRLARKEIIGVQRNWKLWGNGLLGMRESIKRGVTVKLIGVISRDTRARASEWKRIGCKIRAYDKSLGPYPLRFSIFDNKEARITIGKPEIEDPTDYITIWTSSKPLITLLKKQFTAMWEKSARF